MIGFGLLEEREKEMAKVGHLASARNANPIPTSFPAKAKSLNLMHSTTSTLISAASRKNDLSLISRKNSRSPRRLIKISTADGKWHGKWTCNYIFSLRDLSLEDLAEDGHKDARVSINLCIHKHASFGFSVDGRIITCFTRKCIICSSSYCREVIYVKPGYEADLDSLIQDTIRLTTSVKETCSELCEKSEPKLQYIGRQNTTSIDGRWSRLLELRNANL